MGKEKVCSICGIPEKEATRIGVELKTFNSLIGIKCEDERNEEYICTMCLIKTESNPENMKYFSDSLIRVSSFMAFIDSSAALFRISEDERLQACINIFFAGIDRVAHINRSFALTILKSTNAIIENHIKTLESSSGDIREISPEGLDNLKKMFRGGSIN